MAWVPSFSVTKKERPISSEKFNSQILEIFTYLDVLRRNFAYSTLPDNPSIGQLAVKIGALPNEVYVYLEDTVGTYAWRRLLSSLDLVASLVTFTPGTTGLTATNLQAAIEQVVAKAGAASGYATLDANQKVVQDPANSTATPTAAKIPVADADASLVAWVPQATDAQPGKMRLATLAEVQTGVLTSAAVAPDKLKAWADAALVFNGGATPSIQQGPTAMMPAFGTAGRVYIDTTTNLIYRDTGTSWVLIGGSGGGSGGAATLPVFREYETTLLAGATLIDLSGQILSTDMCMLVFRNGLIQKKDVDYTYNSSTRVVTATDMFTTDSVWTFYFNFLYTQVPFTLLADTFSSYSGHGGKVLAVKSDESGLEPVAFPVASTAVAGIARAATLAEVQAGTQTNTFVSPKTLVDAGVGGSSGTMYTVFHSTEDRSTTSATFDPLYSGSFVANSAWHGSTLTCYIVRAGAGQLRVTVSDGTTTVTVDGTVFTAAGTDKVSVSCATLATNVVWTFTVFALASSGTVTLSRIKVVASPQDALMPHVCALGAGGSTNMTTWAQLASCTILPTALQPDGKAGLILSGGVTLTGATGAEVRVTVSGTVGEVTTTTSATATVSASGVSRLSCPYPAVAAVVMSVRIDGRITAGSGTLALPVWQLNMEQ